MFNAYIFRKIIPRYVGNWGPKGRVHTVKSREGFAAARAETMQDYVRGAGEPHGL